MKLNRDDIAALNRTYRLKLINSLTGIKPGNLVGSIDKYGNENLAIISSVVHIGANPPYIGFIMRPSVEFRRDTYNNILENGYYTINSIPIALAKNAHYTSAKFSKNESEFARCNIDALYLDTFKAPFVNASAIKIGLRHVDSIDIKLNGTTLVVGEIVMLSIDDTIIDENAHINLEAAGICGIGGLNSYYSLTHENTYPYARINEIPDFE